MLHTCLPFRLQNIISSGGNVFLFEIDCPEAAFEKAVIDARGIGNVHFFFGPYSVTSQISNVV